ncbi:MFS transporter [Alicyclobacillus sp. TC]|uniref:MFS family permease n=1 Tax=Alicyclobacillus tolerans TaxID=90970 RepID=A0ABT9LUI3_9BACL|nr:MULTISPECIES: MFS transporter [Alicyclobacillus]MDP9727918.1 MFS family permease [Alicyclobacillus tengchongensis]QRF24218.1 MFS transporter [Alicyclobacillus sp. TC]
MKEKINIHPIARRLMETRFLRSVGQGALAVDFTLYLHARGWDATEIGLLLMGGGLANSALSLLVGITSDRVGRKLFLVFYEIGLLAATLWLTLAPSIGVLILSAVLFGFGRGANGASGPFAPAEQAWLAKYIPGRQRGSIFSWNAALQFWGMGIGSLLAGFLPRMLPGTSGSHRFLLLFVLNAVIAAINLLQIATLREDAPVPEELPFRKEKSLEKQSASNDSVIQGQKEVVMSAAESEKEIRHRENRALLLLAVINLVNSVGVGLVAPLLPYWFDVKFGVGPSAIGPVYALTFVLTGLSSIGIGRLTQRFGLVQSIVWPRLLGVALLVALPFVPTFSWAALLYVVRSIVNRGSMGARQALSVSLVRDKRRGFASSLNNLSWSLAASFGPAVGGWLLDRVSFFWPFLIASFLQLAYVFLFQRFMRPYDNMSTTASPKSASHS